MPGKCNSFTSTLFDDRSPSAKPSGLAPALDDLLGTVIDGRYRVEALLGEGGMGLVYRATHTRLGKTLAVKILRHRSARDPNTVARFQREAESASAIGNPHIVDVSDFGTLPDGSTYFVMECLAGVDLITEIEAHGPMSVERACNIGIQLCSALGAAHDTGIVHRDLKPENVFLVGRQGDSDFVKVLDFGIAKVTHEPDRLTREDDFLGTPHYMSPEQCEGRSIDQRTDIYALGVLLYEMVAGRVPHDADTAMAILHKHVYERPTPLELYAPRVPLVFRRVVARCLEKKPERRYQSMREVQDDLERIVQGERTPLPSLVHILERFFPFRLRWSRLSLGVAGAALIALLVAFARSALPTAPAESAASAAIVEADAAQAADVAVPQGLARPAEQPSKETVTEMAPPILLARPDDPPRAEAAPRPRKVVRKKRRRPATKKVREEDVLDPWM